MKRKLEADLISIAHRILQLKNKSDINQLYLETQKLYEKLAVLRFVDEHFSEAKPTIGFAEISSKIESIFDKQDTISEPSIEIKETVIEESETKNGIAEEISETVSEEIEEVMPVSEQQELNELQTEEQQQETAIEEILSEENKLTNIEEVASETPDEIVEIVEDSEIEEDPIAPAFEISELDEIETELDIPKKTEAVQISFEDLLGGNYNDTFFVKKQQVENIPTAVVIETPIEEETIQEVKLDEKPKENIEKSEPKIVSLNDKLAKGINIDLNDRLAFIKHLFGNSSEDYNRVLNQLITFDTFYETRDFIQEMVKPDYNNWEGKQEYEERFMDIIEKKFL